MGDTGYYPHRCERGGGARRWPRTARGCTALFVRKIVERVEEWMALADERLGGDGGLPCFVNAGNDDPPEIDAVIEAAARVEFLEGRVVELPAGMELASCGFANMTPWQCPRDVQEDELGGRLEAVAAQVRDAGVGDLQLPLPALRHARSTRVPRSARTCACAPPPAASRCARWAARRAARCSSATSRCSASTAICTSRAGTFKLGRTLCINPGSEYSEGILRGAIVDINEKKRKVKSTQFISG